jgi:hypothetical protein
VEYHRGTAAKNAARLGTSNDLLEVPMSLQLLADPSLEATDLAVAELGRRTKQRSPESAMKCASLRLTSQSRARRYRFIARGKRESALLLSSHDEHRPAHA